VGVGDGVGGAQELVSALEWAWCWRGRRGRHDLSLPQIGYGGGM
jgi:hypothetical protein